VSLRDRIIQEIRESGPIPFSRYMELCLYDPIDGYYSRNVEQFGKAGDFYTSSDVHAVFGRLLARQFEEIWRVLGCPHQIDIVELGPGRGLFAQDVLDWSEKKFPQFFEALHYRFAERSLALKERLQSTLSRHFAAGKASLVDIQGITQSHAGTMGNAPTIIFANEFFDALPVDVVSAEGELRVCEKEGRLSETWIKPSAETQSFLDRYGTRPEAGERIDVPLLAHTRMASIAEAIREGVLIAIDYGYTRAEQLAGRHRGTLTAYRRHSTSANFYEAPGEQDLTAHVNFTSLSAAAGERGMQVRPLVTQSQFLLGIGEDNQFADAFDDCRFPQERAKVALQLKHLITPAGMGESFHVMVAGKGIDPDLVAGLSGLSFGEPHKRNFSVP